LVVFLYSWLCLCVVHGNLSANQPESSYSFSAYSCTSSAYSLNLEKMYISLLDKLNLFPPKILNHGCAAREYFVGTHKTIQPLIPQRVREKKTFLFIKFLTSADQPVC
jgi:hypothetical protein